MLEFRHCDTERLYSHWQSLREDGLPSHRCWDPAQIPKLTPNMLILELNSDDDFVYRFAGTEVCDFVGVELTGRRMKDFFPSPDVYAATDSMQRAMLGVPCGQLSSYKVRGAAGRECDAELLFLPLAGKNGTADRLLVYMALAETTGFGEAAPEVSENIEATWIDLGWGVPEADLAIAEPQNSHI